MALSPHDHDGQGQAVPSLEQQALDALHKRQRNEDTEALSGLRCGTAVCELLTDLHARGRIRLNSIERDGAAWQVDLTVAAPPPPE